MDSEQPPPQLAEALARARLADSESDDFYCQQFLAALQSDDPADREAVANLWHDAERIIVERARHGECDALTGLANRWAFERELERRTEAKLRYHEEFALVLFDLQRFGEINSTYGHQAGDAVLRRFAQVLVNGRASDSVFRVGGDEFAVILHEQSQPAEYVDRVRREAMGLHPGSGSLEVYVGVARSAELICYRDSTKPEIISRSFATADQQLIWEKQLG